MKKKPKLSTLKNKLDKIFSEYIRRKEANLDGFIECYTCDSVKHWKEIQCGHFISRTYLATRWDPLNCRPQCGVCNVLRRGNMAVYAVRLEEELNHGILQKLHESKFRIVKMNRLEYDNLISYYQEKVSNLAQ